MADAGMMRVPARAVTSLLKDSFVAAGLPEADAARCAELMTEADLTGAEGHGILRLPQYVRRLKARGFNAHPNITVTKSAPATALVDGDNGMGHLVMTRAANEAIAMARDTGVAWVGVRRSNHAGPAGLYAEMPTAHGMIGLYAAVANANHMATWGGTDLLLGTNPLAIGVPSGSGPLVLDMATSIVAYGTVKKYALRGLTMPEGWFVKPETGEADYRSEPLRRRRSAADGRIQGRRPGADARACSAACSTAPRSAATWSTSTPTTPARPIPGISWWRSTSRVFCRSQPSPPKSIAM